MLAVDIRKRHDFNSTYLKSRLHIDHAIPSAADEAHLELAIRLSAPDK
jgi:hypothetical protein